MIGFTTLAGLKSRAKQLKLETGVTHGEALEQVARSQGYASYDTARRYFHDGGAR